MDGSNDRQRKDRLIQTRVPQNLESTLKDEARKRRLSVSHLIRNVLEDTFHLVDNVVSEVDRVVSDSVGMAQTLRRDAQRLAATARGHTAHRHDDARDDDAEEPGPDDGAGHDPAEQFDDEAAPAVIPADDDVAEAMMAIEAALSEPPPPGDPDEASVGSLIPGPMPASLLPPAPLPGDARLLGVVGLQEAIVVRPAACATCGAALRRGVRAYLGVRELPGATPPVWLCVECTDALADQG